MKMGATLSERYTSTQKGTAKMMTDYEKMRKDLMKVQNSHCTKYLDFIPLLIDMQFKAHGKIINRQSKSFILFYIKVFYKSSHCDNVLFF